MSTYLVLTVIGDDKPGLVEMLADTVARHSGNWLESNMSHLAGKFAGILRVSVADAHADALIQDLQKLSSALKLVVEKVRLLVAIRPPFETHCGEIHSHQMNPEFLRQPELSRSVAAGEIAHAGMCSGVSGVDQLHGEASKVAGC